MSAPPAVLQNALGRTIRIGREIGKGGEGAVYEAKDQGDLAIKIYWANKAADRRDKIGAMVSAGWFKASPFVAFPIDVLYSPNGSFAGFVMRRIGGHKPLHLLYSPSSRKLEFSGSSLRFLIRSGLNAARAVASVHATSCVIGDVNHSGFLVSDKATITLIDSDSFQVIASGKNFLCQVGTPEYTPPELQSSRFDRVKRTDNHDNFGLAVLLFQLLFMGRHPFSGRFLGRGEMPLERAISEFRFAYSANKAATSMEPPPNVPLLSDFPDYIAEGFEKTFGRRGVQERPKAESWVSWLERLETELQQCSSNAAHHHVKGRQCPWCRMELANPGFVAFTSNQPLKILPINVDTRQVVLLINSIKDPGPTPDLTSLVHYASPTPTTRPPSALIATLRRQYGVGIGASIVGLLLTKVGIPAFPCLLICGAGTAVTFYPHAYAKQIADVKRQADAGWRAATDAWNRQIGNKTFVEAKQQAESQIRELNNLPTEERRSLQQLDQKKRDIQLKRFLERYQISAAKIRKVGSGRKAVLASFGIETAADIEQQRLAAIQGFGPTLISELTSWRKTLEQRFVFNANEPTSPAEIASVKALIANKKARLENQLRASIASLQQASNFAGDQRRSLIASANAAFARLKQAEAEERLVHPIFIRVAKIVSASCLVIVLLSLGSTPPSPPTSRPTQTAPSPATKAPTLPSRETKPGLPNPQGVPPKPSNPLTPPRTLPRGTEIPPSAPIPAPKPNDIPIAAPSPAPMPAPKLNDIPIAAPSPFPKPSDLPIAVPSLPPPIHIPPLNVPGRTQTPEGQADLSPKRGLERADEATEVQQRLVELGYLTGPADGKWGPRSVRALQDFRAANRLSPNATWDRTTETQLFAANAIKAITATFVGNWTSEAGQCGAAGESPPLRISNTRAVTDGGLCTFDSIRGESDGTWRITARCSVGGNSWLANIQFKVAGNRLTWTSEKGSDVYYRCQN